VPSGSLEGAQSVERRQPRGHRFVGVLRMSLSHLRRDNMSFVESADPSDICSNRLASGEQNVYLHA
jgi:hypothetical protein